MTIPSLLVLTLIAASLAGCANHEIKPLPNDAKHAAAETANSHRRLTDARASKTPDDKRPFVRVARYSTVIPRPTPEQADLLLVLIRMEMPAEVDSVGEAIRYLLRYSGFRLANAGAMQPEVVQMLDKELPRVHRKLGPMTLEDALLVLVGSAFQLDVDHVHRVINYRLVGRREKSAAKPGNVRTLVALPAKEGQSKPGPI